MIPSVIAGKKVKLPIIFIVDLRKGAKTGASSISRNYCRTAASIGFWSVIGKPLSDNVSGLSLLMGWKKEVPRRKATVKSLRPLEKPAVLNNGDMGRYDEEDYCTL
ncbi:MAG: hypothetical protein ACYC2T_11235 [Bacillota bacterium]